MTNIASVIKSEIVRLARKEIRGEMASLRKASTQHRSTIAALRREVAQLRKQVRSVGKARRTTATGPSDDGARQRRFRPAGMAAHRKKLGLSAEAYGLLVGVSGQSIHHWEAGTRPRAKQLEALAAVRGIGKREAARRLETLSSRKSPSVARKKRRA